MYQSFVAGTSLDGFSWPRHRLNPAIYAAIVETSTPALDDSRLDTMKFEIVRHGRVSSLEEAAALRGLPASKIIKTMVVRRSKDRYVFVLVPGNRVIDWSKLREFLGVKRISMADADDAYRRTGYVRGTITPFGSTGMWPVVTDKRLSRGKVSIGGGAPGVSITTSGADLVRILKAKVADVTAPAPPPSGGGGSTRRVETGVDH